LSLLGGVIDAGVSRDLSIDEEICVRSANVVALSLVVVSVVGIPCWYLLARFPVAAMIQLLFGIAYILVIYLNARGRRLVGRVVLVLTYALNYAFNYAVIGPDAGGRDWIIVMLLGPVVFFTSRERVAVAGGYVAIVLGIVLGEVLVGTQGALAPMPEVQENISRIVVAVMVSAVLVLGFYQFKHATVMARERLAQSQMRIAQLLASVFPTAIAARLQESSELIAESHGEATILFADMTGFSALSKRLSPIHLVEMLNNLFSRLDRCAADHGIERIKTIGDCYMAATGILPTKSEGASADRMAEFALAALMIVREVAATMNLPIDIRIGVATGPVIAGVIGRDKPAFDVWGDTVNLASRMESHGAAGHIQVSETTYWRLRDRFDFEPRGEIALKGMPPSQTYLLLGRKGHERAAMA